MVYPASQRAGRTSALVLCLLLTVTTAYGQARSAERVFALVHQSAADAVSLVYPYLSEAGTVELRPGGNALVVRDTPSVIASVTGLLRDFDRPAQNLKLEIQLISAGAGEPGESGLSPELETRLQKLLRYRSYRLLASSKVDASEGLDVLAALNADYEVDFRFGLVGSDRRVKLNGFRVLRRDGDAGVKPLIHTNLNLSLDLPMVLGLARTESSERALMVVLHCTRLEEGVEE